MFLGRDGESPGARFNLEIWNQDEWLASWADCKEIQPVHSEGDQPWDFFGKNDAKAETPVLWPPHVKSWLIGKDSDAGRDWGQEEKGTTEDEMAGWHLWLDGRESEWTLGVGDGQGGLVCCDSWGRKESDTTEWLISDLSEGGRNEWRITAAKWRWGPQNSLPGTPPDKKPEEQPRDKGTKNSYQRKEVTNINYWFTSRCRNHCSAQVWYTFLLNLLWIYLCILTYVIFSLSPI